jgi:glycine/D-amino acid oxidase-like deaminating enzyme/nitrite reductase/ring-hydroxylating ferredoxin subunit
MSDKRIPNDSGTSCSPWMRETVPDFWPALPRPSNVDVCIIGAGITGLSVAYHLVYEGKSVLVLDDGPIGGGETGRTTAHLACALDDRFHELERHHGLHGAAIAAQSHAAAIDDIQAIVDRERIGCDFMRVDGYLFVPPGGDGDELTRELAAAQRAGLVHAELVAGAPLPGFQTGPCIRFPRQAQFHPIKYLRGLAEAVIGRGGRIATGIRAETIVDGAPVVVTTEDDHVIHAAAVVVATNAPISSRVKIPLKQAAYRTYVIGMAVPAGTVPMALYWDTCDPYHYARIIPGGAGEDDLLIVGGEDHKTGQEGDAESRWARLVEWTRERFVGVTDVVSCWSGQIMEPADGLAFIGRDPSADHVYVATGDSGNGLTHGTIAGILLTDLILGRDNPWADVYDPRRSELRRAPGTFLKEAANMAGQYTDWLKGGDVGSADDIPAGAGAVIRRGLHMVAVYRDEEGHCFERSAVCPHLGGIVRWNHAEHSWDCPAHGSRFDCLGRVLNGPANADLGPTGPEGVHTPIPVSVQPVAAPRPAR